MTYNTGSPSSNERKLLEFREKVKIALKKRNLRVNITLNPMICWCVVQALKKHPDINSHFLGESIKTFNKVHLGIAVDTRSGLVVPTVKNADDLSLIELAAQIEDIRRKSMLRKINPDLLLNESASFSVSNLEAYGVEMFTPIINIPQVAILGVNTIMHRPVEVSKGVIGFIPYIGLSLTYDHCALDGGPATRFLRSVKKEIENFEEKVKEQAIRFLLYGTLAEIFARETGFNKGLDGSMHAFFTPFGPYPNNAIVGGSGDISVKAAL